jgi:hypothetical protein
VASKLFQLEGWPSSPSSDNNAHAYNNDTGIWDTGGAPAAPPFTGQVTSTGARRQIGGWDGNFWYVTGPDGKLYRYNPGANTWSAALAAGAVLVSGTIYQQHWCMCSDGRFVYHLTSGGGFRRYDTVNDTLQSLPAIPGGTMDRNCLLIYDGNDTVYGYAGPNPGDGALAKYTISTNLWAALPTLAGISGTTFPIFGAYLAGKLWVIRAQNQQTSQAYAYDPVGNAWANKATVFAGNGMDPTCPFGEIDDHTIRVWSNVTPSAGEFRALNYDVLADTWALNVNSSFNTLQGSNHAVTRLINPTFSWFQADGVTPAAPTILLPGMNVGDVVSLHLVVQTPVSRALGATVSVPALIGGTGNLGLSVCATANGTYGASFSTGALAAGQTFDVFVKVAPTSSQSLGLSANGTLKVVGN